MGELGWRLLDHLESDLLVVSPLTPLHHFFFLQNNKPQFSLIFVSQASNTQIVEGN